jgi:predicted nucleotidyltransferase
VNVLEAALARLAADLDALGFAWALVGGFAVSARCEPRFTRDVDVAVVAADDADAEDLIRRLSALGYSITTTVDQEYVDRLAAARLRVPLPGGVLVDVLLASSGIEAEIVAEAERLEVVSGLVLPVATAAHLVVTKLLARDDTSRPQDAADLVALRRVVAEDDLAHLRAAIALVQSRGFARERDLAAALDAWWTTREGS